MSVEVKSVTKIYPLGKTEVLALKGINLTIEEGEFTTIAGPSGSGKTTLLNMIGCMDKPSTGELFLDKQPISQLTDKELTNLRLHKIGFIFQSFNLIPVLTVFQNVEFPLLLRGGLNAKERAQKVEELIEKVGLKPQMRNRSNELSGGQRQRVAIARALVTSPKVVLADEPTANLDSETGSRIIALMKEMNALQKTTFIFSTHDPSVMQHATRVIKLKDGLVVEGAK